MLSYFYDDTEVNFDVQLLENIKDKNNEKVEKYLQNVKDSYSAVDALGSSLLHYAAEFGNETATLQLIKLGSKINLQNNNGNTPLLLATKGQHAATIKVLLESDADMYICNKEGTNALQLALHISPTNVEIAKLFLEQLKSDCSSDSAEIAKRLMKIECPLYVAVLIQDTNNVMTCMISEGCSINAKDPSSGKTALHVAVENLVWHQVNYLRHLGADVNAKDALYRTPLALLNNFDDEDNSLDILEELLKTETELTSCAEDGTMQMHSILANGPAEAVQLVIECEFNISITDQRKQNILHYLAKNVNEGVVEMINKENIFDKVDVNARDQDGNTPLHYAMSIGNRNFVRCLIEKSPKWNIENNKGLTPFLQAIDSTSESTLRSRVKCVKILLNNSINPDILLGQYFKVHSAKSTIKRDFALLKPVIAMLTLWKGNNTAISQDILNRLESYPQLKEYYDFCTSVVKKMKDEILYEDTTLFDYLAFNENGLDLHPIKIRYIGSKIRNLAKKYQTVSIYAEILEKCVDDMFAWKDNDQVYLALYAALFITIMVMVIVELVLFNYSETYDEKYKLYIFAIGSIITCIVTSTLGHLFYCICK